MTTFESERDQEDRLSPEFARTGGPVAFAFRAAPEVLGFIVGIDTIVDQAQEGKGSFHRSSDPVSSFYPKVPILSLDDIAPDRAKAAISFWHSQQNPFSETAGVSCQIIDVERTAKGLLMLILEASEDISRQRKMLAIALQEFRSENEEKEQYGVKHWSGFPHLTIGTNVTPEQHEEIRDKLAGLGIIGKTITLSAPIMYPVDYKWGTEVTLEIL